MDSLLLLLAGFVIGWWAHRISVLKRILKNPDDIIQLLQKYKVARLESEISLGVANPRNIRIEKHGDQLYLYAEDTNEFLTQAATLQDALASLEKRFPTQTFRGHLDKKEVDALGIKV
jgi:hypothetical protein